MATSHRSTELRARGRESAPLVKRIAHGDVSAFVALYDATCGLIYGLLLRILGDSAAAEQVMAAVYQEVWEQAAIYDEREKPLTWLVTMAHRRAVARLRADRCSQPRQPALELAGRVPAAGSGTDETSSGEQTFAQTAFAGLSPSQQQMIELAYFSGLRREEIAARLGLSLQAVQTGMRAGMLRLRDALNPRQLQLP
jgi:RNA polymerase sigma-70 factor (ECF subfamily)